MPDYEIPILQSDGIPALITSETQLTGSAAIRSTRKLAQRGRSFEVWRGPECITGLAALPEPPTA
jgi:hypothetical protein